MVARPQAAPGANHIAHLAGDASLRSRKKVKATDFSTLLANSARVGYLAEAAGNHADKLNMPTVVALKHDSHDSPPYFEVKVPVYCYIVSRESKHRYNDSMAYKSQAELRDSLEKAAALVPVGDTYAHYKNPDQAYTVTGHVVMEANDDVGIIYQANYGERISFVRSLESWLEQVDDGGKTVPRFSNV